MYPSSWLLLIATLVVQCCVAMCIGHGDYKTCPSPGHIPCRNSSNSNDNSCEYVCNRERCEIRVIVILPDSSQLIASLSEVMSLLRHAITDIHRASILPNWVKIELEPWDDKCDASYAQIATIDAHAEGKCIHMIIGPVCDYCLATVSRIVKFLGTPLLTAGGFSQDFEKPKITCADEYFMLMRTGVMYYAGLARFLRLLLNRYGWKKLMFLYDKNDKFEVAGQNTCSLVMQTIVGEVKHLKGFEYEDGDMGLSTLPVKEFLKAKIGTDFGITVMCTSTNITRDVLLAAESLDQMVYNGEYVFINIDLTNSGKYPDKPWIDDSTNDDGTVERLERAYRSVLTLTSETIEGGSSKKRLISRSNLTSGFYDALLLYAHAISPLINTTSPGANEQTRISSFDIVPRMWGSSFQGLNGQVNINCNGDRLNTYSLLSYNSKIRGFEPVASYADNNDDFEWLPDRQIEWANSNGRAPADVPTCGYDNSKCPDKTLPGSAILSIVLAVVLIILAVGTYFMYKKQKLEADISSMTWKVYWEDVEHVQEIGRNQWGSVASLANKSRGSQLTVFSDYSYTADRQVFIPTGFYKKTKVAIKDLPELNNVDFKRSQLIELKKMKDMSHDHLVKFFGACLEPPHCCLLTEYCSKGSLQDILENEQFNMDNMISISLLQDIIRGMMFLHNSEIKSHGNLTSANCVVDSRLVVKITDFGLHFLKNYDDVELESHGYWKKKLWTAPELLRKPVYPPGGTQKGDVYSFGIIMHEVIFRKGPFYLGENEHMDPKDIIGLVKDEWKSPHFRPYLDKENSDHSNDEFLDWMEKCWVEEECDRPDFKEIKRKFWKLNESSEKGNILDNLLSRMEQYANNLEYLVEQRTEAYLNEKEKCEKVLYQLLPKSVAAQLIAGCSVAAETYDQVTVYFSDIVGFTSLSADSTPMQVVDLLNALYTCFDSTVEHFDVYKVETIGDAYMVVSGLPVRNGTAHAPEIARMALALLAEARRFTIPHRPSQQLRLRIGIHTGPCVAGVVGLKMPRYCLFGDTVNTASRMESNGLPARIHVSATTKQLLDYYSSTDGNAFRLECRGELDIKGKGKMVTYWLLDDTSSSDNITNVEEAPLTTSSSDSK